MAHLRSRLNTIRFKVIFITVAIILLLMSVTGFYFYISMSKILSDNANKEFSQLLLRTNESMESQLNMVDSALMFFISNPVILKNIEEATPGQDNYDRAMKKINIEKQLSYLLLNNYLWDSKSIKSVYIFENKDSFYHIDRFYSPGMVERNIRVYETIAKKAEGLQFVVPSPADPTIYFIRNMNNLYSLKYAGTIIVGIDVDALSMVYGGIHQYKDCLTFITNDKQRIMLGTDKNLLGKKAPPKFVAYFNTKGLKEVHMHGTAYLVTAKAIPKYGWTSVIIVPKKQIFGNLSRSVFTYFRAIFAILLVFIFLSIFFSARVINPINDLVTRIEEIRNGNFTVKMPHYKDFELNQLSAAFNKMTEEIEYLINDVYRKQLLLQESELKSLHSQINPHFLFNVLDTISWYARASKNDEINNIVIPLSRILRANITMGNREKIKIDEELRYIEFYLAIQKNRFGDRLTTELNIENNSLKDFLVPKLCIQPIVENAIIHGLEEKMSDGKLIINISRNYNDIIFEIIDNGIGFTGTALNLDNMNHSNGLYETHPNIGLSNANKRIKLLYGENYGISLQSVVNEGTRVTVRIPIDQGGPHDV